MLGWTVAKSWMLAAGFGLALISTGARAADLEDGPPPPPRYGGAYDDSRYADIYRYPDRPPVPPARVYRDDDYPPPPPGRFEQRYSHRGACVPRHVIRDRLMREGWQDFRVDELQGNVVTLHARRPSGRPFLLTIDRCSGDVVDARPAYQPGPTAYGPTPRRYYRPYY